MIYCFGSGGDWQGDSDLTLNSTRCYKCGSQIHYRRDGGPAFDEAGLTEITCPYCGFNHRISMRTNG